MALESVTHIGDLVPANPAAGDPKSKGDDHIRAIKTALANDFAGFTGSVLVTGVDSGGINAYTLTPAKPLPAYSTKMLVLFSPFAANTGAATLNISTLGALPIKRVDGSDVVSGDMPAGSLCLAICTGTEFRMAFVTKNYADQLAFASSLPAQPGGANQFFLQSVGGVASWSPMPSGSAIYAYNNFGGF